MAEVLFTRGQSVGQKLERLIEASTMSFDAAFYRFNNERLARALDEARQRGVRIRLVVDRGKYEESKSTQKLLSKGRFPFRVARGPRGAGSKMHHKFAILDGTVVVTGSYNWTLESEEQNYENALVLREPELVKAYGPEFEALWMEAKEI